MTSFRVEVHTAVTRFAEDASDGIRFKVPEIPSSTGAARRSGSTSFEGAHPANPQNRRTVALFIFIPRRPARVDVAGL
jgi:hypothetical protein